MNFEKMLQAIDDMASAVGVDENVSAMVCRSAIDEVAHSSLIQFRADEAYLVVYLPRSDSYEIYCETKISDVVDRAIDRCDDEDLEELARVFEEQAAKIRAVLDQ